jgi:hypothetical protein
MRRSWAANGIAAFVIAITFAVGALGTFGSPRKPVAAAKEPTPQTDPVRACRSITTRTRDLSFTCPGGWLLWENDAFTDDPVQRALIIVSNKAPLDSGSDDLPDGWFKADVGLDQRVAGLTFARLAISTCSERLEYERTVSCRTISIDGRAWVLRVARDVGFEYRLVATVVDGVAYHAIAYIPLGAHSEEGRREVSTLIASLRVR